MSDDTTRTLERRYSATQDPADLVALLSARLRDGSLDQRRVELAAYLGHEAAWEAAGRPWFGRHGERLGSNTHGSGMSLLGAAAPRALDEWAQGLARYGREAAIRCALAGEQVAWSAASPCAGLCTDPTCPIRLAREAHDAARAWVCDPNEARRIAWQDAWGAASAPDWLLCAAASFADGWATLCQLAIERAARETSPEEIRSAVLRDVAPWALGLYDPLRDQARAARPDP